MSNLTANQEEILKAVEGVTKNKDVALAMLMGAELESSDDPTAVGGSAATGFSYGAWQFQNTSSPAGAAFTIQNADNPQWEAQEIVEDYTNAAAQIPQSTWSSNPELAGEETAVLAEKPQESYYQARGTAAVNNAYNIAIQEEAGSISDFTQSQLQGSGESNVGGGSAAASNTSITNTDSFLSSFNKVLNPSGSSLDPFADVAHGLDMLVVRGACVLVGLIVMSLGVIIIAMPMLKGIGGAVSQITSPIGQIEKGAKKIGLGPSKSPTPTRRQPENVVDADSRIKAN